MRFQLLYEYPNRWVHRVLRVDPPLRKAGDHIDLIAEIDLIIGMTACSALQSNGGSFKPIHYRVSSWCQRSQFDRVLRHRYWSHRAAEQGRMGSYRYLILLDFESFPFASDLLFVNRWGREISFRNCKATSPEESMDIAKASAGELCFAECVV